MAVGDSATHALILNTEVIARLQQCKAVQIAAMVTDHDNEYDEDDVENDISTADVHNDAIDGDTTGNSRVQGTQQDNNSEHMEHSNNDRSQQSDVQALIND